MSKSSVRPHTKAVMLLLVCALLWSSVVPLVASAQEPDEVLALVGRDHDSLLVELSLGHYSIATRYVGESAFSVIRADNLNNGGLPGAPDLPIAAVWLVAPPHAAVSLTVVSSRTTTVNLDSPPLPVPQLDRSRWDHNHTAPPSYVYKPAPDYYQRSGMYPSDLCSIASDTQVREWRLIQLRCNPVRYRSNDSSLVITTKALLRVSYQGADAPLAVSASTSSSLTHVLAGSVLNPQDLGRFAHSVAPRIAAQEVPQAPGKLRLETASGSGIYVVTFEELAAASASFPDNLEASKLRLMHGGQEAAILVQDNDHNGSFGTGDAILFFAEERQSPYGTENAYWLTWGTENGKRIGSRSGAPDGSQPVHLTASVRLRNYDPRYPDPWRSDWKDLYIYDPSYSMVAEDGHFFAGELRVRDEMPDIEWFAAYADSALGGFGTLTISFQGITEGKHIVVAEFRTDASPPPTATHSVYLAAVLSHSHGSASTASSESPYSTLGTCEWEGNTAATCTFSVPVPYGLQILRLSLPGQRDGDAYLNEVAYVVAPVLEYTIGVAGDGNVVARGTEGAATYTLAGFSSADVLVWDTTDPWNPVALTGIETTKQDGYWLLRFSDNRDSAANYAISDNSSYKRVASIEQPLSLSIQPQAQYLIVTHPDFTEAAQALATHRQNHDQLTTRVVTTQAIYDHFSEGLLDPGAIRSFVLSAYDSWLDSEGNHTLTYLLLLGDGSYDFKNRTNHGKANYLPPYLVEGIDPNWGQAASDHLLGNREQGRPPSVEVGRIPVRTAADAMSVVQKIINYDTYGIPATAAGSAVFSADDPDRRDYGDGTVIEFGFDTLAEEALTAALGTGRILSSKVNRIYQSNEATPPPGYYYNESDADTEALLALWRQGTLISYYVGHSHYWGWAFPKLFAIEDIDTMGETPLTVQVSMTCFTGFYYHPAQDSLDEALLHAASRGTASSFSPLSMGSAQGHRMMQKDLLTTLLDGATLGEALLAGKLALDYHTDLVDTYAVLGDPALRLFGTSDQPAEPHAVMLPLIVR